MTKARMDGLYLLGIGWILFVLLSVVIFTRMPISMLDFRVNYFPAYSLLHHGDPYNAKELWEICLKADPVAQVPKADHELDIIRYNYPPSVLIFFAPLALLPLAHAQVVLLVLEIIGFTVAALLIWQIAARSSPTLSGALIGILLSGCAWTAAVGNLGGIVISLTTIAAWCFLEQQVEWAGVLCLGAGLALKPHICLFVWGAFFLFGPHVRRRALQSMALALALGIAGAVWVGTIAPSWLSEFKTNIAGLELRGGFNDPGPSSSGGHGLGMIIDLQSALSLIRDDPHFYNPVAFALTGILLLYFVRTATKDRKSLSEAWFALAAIAPLTMLPFYHRQGDAKLVLLAVPACALLCAEGRLLGKVAVAVTLIEFVTIHEIPWAIFLRSINDWQLWDSAKTGKILLATQLAPVPLVLFGACGFYLWVYRSRVAAKIEGTRSTVPSIAVGGNV